VGEGAAPAVPAAGAEAAEDQKAVKTRDRFMVDEDVEYVRRLIAAKTIHGPVLELGTGYEGTTCAKMIRAAGLTYIGTDVVPGPHVDVVADFEVAEQLVPFRSFEPFGTILILNVLEHTFDPIRILDNATTLLRDGGCLVVLTPTVWPLHDYPMDTWRIMPSFYEEYAKRRGMVLVPETLEFVGHGTVASHRATDGCYALPRPARTRAAHWYGKVVHKLFNTFGRSMFHPSHVATGAVLRKCEK
jgi:SAM-dependent methyltransferase